MTVSRVGQATFLSSAQLSTRYRRMPVNTIGSYFLLRGGVQVRVRWSGRGDRTRTCNRWFWRPVLYQLSYTPPSDASLLRLPVQLVLPAARAELVQLQAPRVVPLALPRAVRALLADGARQADHGSILGLCHVVSRFVVGPRQPRRTRGGSPGESPAILLQRPPNRQRAGPRTRLLNAARSTRITSSRAHLSRNLLASRTVIRTSDAPTGGREREIATRTSRRPANARLSEQISSEAVAAGSIPARRPRAGAGRSG